MDKKKTNPLYIASALLGIATLVLAILKIFFYRDLPVIYISILTIGTAACLIASANRRPK